jgi:hypothetical protein
MLRYGVNDLRLFFDGDIRFLSSISKSSSAYACNMPETLAYRSLPI